jgi:DNA invertase Pin-like site-specific DNA recombinase
MKVSQKSDVQQPTSKKIAQTIVLAHGRAAIYARFSTDNQKDTSIEDQVRRCRAKALTEGLDVPDSLVFGDFAISGKEVESRVQYQRLLAAWAKGEFEVLVVDQQSRICRNKIETAVLEEKIKLTGVRVICCGGVDTKNPGWDIIWAMTGTFDAKYRDDTAFAVKRGQEGAVLRGYSVSVPPYGYDRVPELSPSGDRLGTKFKINVEEAEIVKRIYRERSAGEALWPMVRRLNAEGILRRGKLWDRSSVRRVLENPIYAGKYVVSGVSYERPELKLVEDNFKAVVSPGSAQISKTGRGGGTSWATGLLRCSYHGAKRVDPKKGTVPGHYDGRYMTVKHNGKGQFLFCPECANEERAGVRTVGIPYVSSEQLQALFTVVMRSSFTPQSLEGFRQAVTGLRDKLPVEEVQTLNARVAGVDRAIARVVTSISLVDDEIAVEELQRRLVELQTDKKQAQGRLKFLQEEVSSMDTVIYEKQLSVDPRKILPLIFECGSPQSIRSVLSQLFRDVVLLPWEGLDRGIYRYRVTFSVANAIAHLTKTPALLDDWQTLEFEVRSSSRRTIAPVVSRLFEDGSKSDEGLGQTRTCVTCQQVKLLESFYLFNETKNSCRNTQCNACKSKYTVALARKRRLKRQAEGSDKQK